jgi:hypothetical protein
VYFLFLISQPLSDKHFFSLILIIKSTGAKRNEAPWALVEMFPLLKRLPRKARVFFARVFCRNRLKARRENCNFARC